VGTQTPSRCIDCLPRICKEYKYMQRLGNDWVDIYYRVANPSIWMYYVPDPDMNRVSFVYM